MSQTIQYPTEPHPERLAANEIRIKGGERLHNVNEARNYLAMQVVEPTVSVTSTPQVSNIEANPPVAQHIVSNTSEVTPDVTASENPTPVVTADQSTVEEIRAQVAQLADTPDAQIARDEYGIFS